MSTDMLTSADMSILSNMKQNSKPTIKLPIETVNIIKKIYTKRLNSKYLETHTLEETRLFHQRFIDAVKDNDIEFVYDNIDLINVNYQTVLYVSRYNVEFYIMDSNGNPIGPHIICVENYNIAKTQPKNGLIDGKSALAYNSSEDPRSGS